MFRRDFSYFFYATAIFLFCIAKKFGEKTCLTIFFAYFFYPVTFGRQVSISICRFGVVLNLFFHQPRCHVELQGLTMDKPFIIVFFHSNNISYSGLYVK